MHNDYMYIMREDRFWHFPPPIREGGGREGGRVGKRVGAGGVEQRTWQNLQLSSSLLADY